MNTPDCSEIEENTLPYKKYILCTKKVNLSYKTKEGAFVVLDDIKKTEEITEHLTDDYEISNNNIYILNKKQSNFEPSIYFEFEFTLKKVNSIESRVLLLEEKLGIDISDIVKKYGVHDAGLNQHEAVTKAVEDGCIEYLEFAKRKLYRFEPISTGYKAENFIDSIVVLDENIDIKETHYLIGKALESKNAQTLAFLHETMKIKLGPWDICKGFSPRRCRKLQVFGQSRFFN